MGLSKIAARIGAAALATSLPINFLLAASGALAADPHKSMSIDQVPSKIKTAAGKKVWDSQMEGKDSHALTKTLPDGVSLDDLSQLFYKKSYAQLCKQTNNSELQKIGAIKYPGHTSEDKLFIAVASLANSDGYKGCGQACAETSIVVFKLTQPHQLQVVARTKEGQFFANGWPAGSASQKAASKAADGDELYEDELTAMDRAVFKLAPDTLAFGLRLGHNDGYSGGGGQAQFLHLFICENDSIKQVFGSPIYDYQMLAGDWNKDQTRQHFSYEDAYGLSIEAGQSDGYSDLLLTQNMGGKQHCRYQYSVKSGVYAPRDKIPTIYYASEQAGPK